MLPAASIVGQPRRGEDRRRRAEVDVAGRAGAGERSSGAAARRSRARRGPASRRDDPVGVGRVALGRVGAGRRVDVAASTGRPRRRRSPRCRRRRWARRCPATTSHVRRDARRGPGDVDADDHAAPGRGVAPVAGGGDVEVAAVEVQAAPDLVRAGPVDDAPAAGPRRCRRRGSGCADRRRRRRRRRARGLVDRAATRRSRSRRGSRSCRSPPTGRGARAPRRSWRRARRRRSTPWRRRRRRGRSRRRSRRSRTAARR